MIFMAGGKVVEQGTAKEIFEHPKEERTLQFLRGVLPNYDYMI